MVKITVTLMAEEVDTRVDYNLMLRDAISEFCASRMPYGTYVNRRYAGVSQEWLDAKVLEVQRRVEAASELRVVKVEFTE